VSGVSLGEGGLGFGFFELVGRLALAELMTEHADRGGVGPGRQIELVRLRLDDRQREVHSGQSGQPLPASGATGCMTLYPGGRGAEPPLS